MENSGVTTDYLSDKYKGYYTCGSTYNIKPSRCTVIYYIKETLVSGTTYTISKGDKITPKITSSIKSEVGLYRVEDDYGDSYIFRGDVTNNNVLFGGYYWKIVRINGDSSIRLIYNGKIPNASGMDTSINNNIYSYSATYPITNSPIEARHRDPTYAGYMYGKNFAKSISAVTTNTQISPATKYYFADDYDFDTENEVFYLKKASLEPISKTFSEMNETDTTTGKKLYELYPYTCKATAVDDSCEVINQIKSIPSSSSARVQYHSYSSKDKDSTKTNDYSSNIKTQIDKWYGTNITNKKDDNGNLITDYIVDGTFCNDRSTPNLEFASGYLLSEDTWFGSYVRLHKNTDKTATLKCNADISDRFSYTTNKGNGLLEYPVALITIDEVALAGGKSVIPNNDFYLNNSQYYWTMSPANYSIYANSVGTWFVSPNGALSPGSNASNALLVRPVINILPNVLISQGDGSVENPFVLKLA